MCMWNDSMTQLGCVGHAAQSVVSIADYRRDASGAQLAEGTGSGIVWDT